MLIDQVYPSPRVYIFHTASNAWTPALLWCLLPTLGFWTLLLTCFLPMLSHLAVLAAPPPPRRPTGMTTTHHKMSMLDQSAGLGRSREASHHTRAKARLACWPVRGLLSSTVLLAHLLCLRKQHWAAFWLAARGSLRSESQPCQHTLKTEVKERVTSYSPVKHFPG